ncbi:MAG: dephospho-CoA kinase [Solirubrobacterales bacterium]
MTGGVAAGKSTFLGLLEKAGVPTLSADAVVHEIYEQSDFIGIVAKRLGPQVVENGAINREAVAEAIFAEPEARVWIEQQIWPRVGQRILDFRKHWESVDEPPKLIVVEVPLLFEAGMDQAFDVSVAVVAEQGERLLRAKERGDVEIDAREERQMPQDEKAERADIVIENDGTIENLESYARDLPGMIEDLRFT